MPTMDDDEKLIAGIRAWADKYHANASSPACTLHEDAERLDSIADRLSALKAERDRMAAALGKLADDARWWKMPEVENQEYIADACMAMLRLMRACARAALSQEPTQ